MHQLARTIGFLYMISGVVLLFSPAAAREIVHTRVNVLRSLANWQLEYSQLSAGALRLLGVWSFLIGVLLVAVTAKPVEATSEGVISPETRRAA